MPGSTLIHSKGYDPSCITLHAEKKGSLVFLGYLLSKLVLVSATRISQ